MCALDACPGPFRLDLGDVLYAPNAFVDGSGRALLVAWEQELRSGGGFDYAGCLSLPRVLTLRGALALLHLQLPAHPLNQPACRSCALLWQRPCCRGDIPKEAYMLSLPLHPLSQVFKRPLLQKKPMQKESKQCMLADKQD